MLKKNIVFTGAPGVGKTTLIEKLARRFENKVRGFITKELIEGGKRVGFQMLTSSGKEAVLAHVSRTSAYKVSQYGVDMRTLDLGAQEILDGIGGDNVIFIDEIGKMELFSQNFRDAVLKALDSPGRVIASIMLTPNPFADEIKRRRDVQLIEVTMENRNILPDQVFRDISRPDSLR